MIFEIIPANNGFIVQPSSAHSRSLGEVSSEEEIWVFPSWEKASEWLAEEYSGNEHP